MKMLRYTKEEQKIDVWPNKKKIQQSKKKITALFLNFVQKMFNLKRYFLDKKILKDKVSIEWSKMYACSFYK